ncbi:MAG: acetyl-CoA carboxylase biotin carboxyl carrier protein subunit [Ignavibacteriae bacterium HGW-Ignavibacteriae-3]|nr:MAG: acetyl-CoA carboxylase biotin carboxyl carrier protein subunit [Ignavibacteriae bacterium HGW-Ignavibacteriae-3]
MEDQRKVNKLIIDDTAYETLLTGKFKNRKQYIKKDPNLINAFIPGVIRDINVKKGQSVKEGDQLLILEAMKMKNILSSHRNGKIKEIKVKSGDMVLKNQLLIVLE